MLNAETRRHGEGRCGDAQNAEAQRGRDAERQRYGEAEIQKTQRRRDAERG
jgi:hypothetical protein